MTSQTSIVVPLDSNSGSNWNGRKHGASPGALLEHSAVRGCNHMRALYESSSAESQLRSPEAYPRVPSRLPECDATYSTELQTTEDVLYCESIYRETYI